MISQSIFGCLKSGKRAHRSWQAAREGKSAAERQLSPSAGSDGAQGGGESGDWIITPSPPIHKMLAAVKKRSCYGNVEISVAIEIANTLFRNTDSISSPIHGRN